MNFHVLILLIETLQVTYEYELIINTTAEATNGGCLLNVLSTNYRHVKFAFAQN